MIQAYFLVYSFVEKFFVVYYFKLNILHVINYIPFLVKNSKF